MTNITGELGVVQLGFEKLIGYRKKVLLHSIARYLLFPCPFLREFLSYIHPTIIPNSLYTLFLAQARVSYFSSPVFSFLPGLSSQWQGMREAHLQWGPRCMPLHRQHLRWHLPAKGSLGRSCFEGRIQGFSGLMGSESLEDSGSLSSLEDSESLLSLEDWEALWLLGDSESLGLPADSELLSSPTKRDSL